MSTFRREIQRPSAAKLWQIPDATALPIFPGWPERSTPLEVQATSYLAASVRMANFSRTSISAPCPSGMLSLECKILPNIHSVYGIIIARNICSCKEKFFQKKGGGNHAKNIV